MTACWCRCGGFGVHPQYGVQFYRKAAFLDDAGLAEGDGWMAYQWVGSFAPRKEVEYKLVVAEKDEHHEGVPSLIKEVKEWPNELMYRHELEALVITHLEKGSMLKNKATIRDMYDSADSATAPDMACSLARSA